MKAVLWFALVMGAALAAPPAVAEKRPAHPLHVLRRALLVGVGLARGADLVTTRVGIARGGREVMIGPVADSTASLALFEAAAWQGEVLLDRAWGDRHPKLAVLAHALSLAAIAATAGHNIAVMKGMSSAGQPSLIISPVPGLGPGLLPAGHFR